MFKYKIWNNEQNNCDNYSTFYGSDTDKDECVKDLKNNIKYSERKYNTANVDDYEATLHKLENHCKNLFTNFKQAYSRGKQCEKTLDENYLNMEFDDKNNSSKKGSNYSRNSAEFPSNIKIKKFKFSSFNDLFLPS